MQDSNTLIFNPWHSVSFGIDAPAVVNAIIEIPKGSRAKYELDKETGLLKLDRVLYSSVDYPANYGFIPKTYCDDNDPLDILVISQVNIVPMCLVSAKIIGVMRMIDGGESDDKIIAVAANDVRVNYINDLESLPPYFSNEIKHFFEEYKRLEKKTVEVIEFRDSETARQIVQQAIVDYSAKFGV
ncbi:inorganic pyrophosphatase [Sphingobacteriaceae bacterium]|nr:inorganic pyrophosphatase [Sphingobacteriaceae bacterium]